MRKMTWMGFGLALSLAGAAVAQQPQSGPPGPPAGGMGMRRGPGGPGRGMMMEALFQGITLSDAQKAQLAKLHAADSAKMEANRDAMRAQMDSMRAARQRGDTVAARAIRERGMAAMQAHFDQQAAAIRSVLTADQRAQFDKNLADVKARMQQRMQGGGPGMGPRGEHTRGPRRERGARGAAGAALFQGISLTDAQKTQLRQLRQSNRAGTDSMRARLLEARAARLRGDTAKARALWTSARQQLQQSRDQRLAAVRNVLTADQRTQFDKNVQQLRTRVEQRRSGRRDRRGPVEG